LGRLTSAPLISSPVLEDLLGQILSFFVASSCSLFDLFFFFLFFALLFLIVHFIAIIAIFLWLLADVVDLRICWLAY
jgi:hypothetical protein